MSLIKSIIKPKPITGSVSQSSSRFNNYSYAPNTKIAPPAVSGSGPSSYDYQGIQSLQIDKGVSP